MSSQENAVTTVASGNDYEQHNATYAAFIRFSIAAIFLVLLLLVSLVGMCILGGFAFWVGLFGLLLGMTSVIGVLVADGPWIFPLLIFAGTILGMLPSL